VKREFHEMLEQFEAAIVPKFLLPTQGGRYFPFSNIHLGLTAKTIFNKKKVEIIA